MTSHASRVCGASDICTSPRFRYVHINMHNIQEGTVEEGIDCLLCFYTFDICVCAGIWRSLHAGMNGACE